MNIASRGRKSFSETTASPPPGAARRAISIFIVVYLLWQIYLPASFYLSDNRSDERFAWRMFSDLYHLQKTCSLAVYQTAKEPGYRPPRDPNYPRSFLFLLQHGRTAVAAKFLRARCNAYPLLARIWITRTCPAPDGSQAPSGRLEIDCFSGLLKGTLEGP